MQWSVNLNGTFDGDDASKKAAALIADIEAIAKKYGATFGQANTTEVPWEWRP